MMSALGWRTYRVVKCRKIDDNSKITLPTHQRVIYNWDPNSTSFAISRLWRSTWTFSGISCGDGDI